jgi:hypothetical protein
MLNNPADAYVHGRQGTRRASDAAGNVGTVTAEVPRAVEGADRSGRC